MIVSPEVFYNLSALLHIAMLVFVVILIVGQVVILVAKYRAVRSMKRDMAEMSDVLEDLPELLKEMHQHLDKEESKPVVAVKRKRTVTKKVAKKITKKNK